MTLDFDEGRKTERLVNAMELILCCVLTKAP